MKTSIDMNWKGGMAFETEMNGHKIIVDASDEVGGQDFGATAERVNDGCTCRMHWHGCGFYLKKNAC